MKKIIIAILSLVSLAFAQINLNDSKVIDNIGIGGIYPNMKLVDFHAAGVWFLRDQFPAKWERVANDEFELHDALNKASNTLKQLIPVYYKRYLNQKSIINSQINFGKYDFDTKCYPLEGIVTKDTYFYFNGSNLINNLNVFFDNPPSEKERELCMPPKSAEEFLNNRKDNFGNVNRTLNIRYYFIIKKINTNVDTINQNTTAEGFTSNPNVKLIGHLYKIEIIDPINNKILKTINNK